jgi:uncharacterized protein YjbJ (UPF0337 family)
LSSATIRLSFPSETVERAKGAIKDTAGKVTGDKELQTRGKLDKAEDSAHKIAGDIKDSVEKGNE